MHDPKTQLAALIASRICHDLISPVGAISNGLELVALSDGGTNTPELDLISDSVDNANARIRYFRVAYGAANDTAMMKAADVRTILEGVNKGGRIRVVWAQDEDCSRSEAQLAFLGLQCVETALSRGGDITVSLAPQRIEIIARAERFSIDESTWGVIADPARLSGAPEGKIPLAPAQVQFALLPLLAADKGRQPSMSHDEASLTLVI